MAPVPISLSAAGVDLSPRLQQTKAVTASPTDATETIIATLTLVGDIAVVSGIALFGWAAFTAGTNGVSATLKLRRTNASGTTVASSGAVTAVAASLYGPSILGFDTGPTMPGQVYVLTLTVGSASAGSTVSAVELLAVIA